MADNCRGETTTRKRGRSKLLVRLFLLDPDKNVTKVTKEIGSKKGLSELEKKGCGPPSKDYCVSDDKVEFAFDLTNEEFKQKLLEIYPTLKNACFVFMKAGKDNTLNDLNPGRCCYGCYTPENVYNSERGQGRLYIKIIPENEISACNHGISLLKRFRSTFGGNQQLYVPILPKPVVPSSTGVTTKTTVTSLVTPANYQLSVPSNSDSRTLLCNLPALDLSSLPIDLAQVESTPACQNSGNVLTQTAVNLETMPQVSRLEKSTLPASATVSENATGPQFGSSGSSGNMVTQSQLPAPSIVVSQSASTPGVRYSVRTNSLSVSQPFGNSLDLVPLGESPTSANVSQTVSTLAVNSVSNTLSQRHSVTPPTNYLPPLSQPLNNSVDMLPQEQLPTTATVSQLVSGTVQPLGSGITTPQGQIGRSVGVSDENVKRCFLNAGPQLVTQSSYASFSTEQELREFTTILDAMNAVKTYSHEWPGSGLVSSVVNSDASSRIAQSPGLNLLAAVGEAQRAEYEETSASGLGGSNIQNTLESQRERLRIDEYLENVKSTRKLKISLDVLDTDALLKKLNDSKMNIDTVEIESTCEVHLILEKLSLPSCLKVLRINENSLNFGDITELLKCLRNVNNLHELDLRRTKFKESTFFAFICSLNYCKDLTRLILIDNGLTEQEITGLISVFASMKNLKILNLSKCNLTETQANAILHKHEQAKNIAFLDLSQNALKGNEIVTGICQLQSLEELDLSHNAIRFSPLPNLQGKRNHLSTRTKKISLSSNHMKPDDFSQFCSLIRSDLSELILDFNHVGHSIWSLCSLGEKIKHLKVLSLANTDVCENVDSLAFLLVLVRELEKLNLSSNNLMADHFQQLQPTLSKLTQLKTLNLSMNYIGRDGMKALAGIFEEFALLEQLNMNSSYIREDEVSVFCKSLVSSKKLKSLDLSGNHIDIEVLNGALEFSPTLEELLFSDIIHGEKLFAQMKMLQNLKKLHLDKLLLRGHDVEILVSMLPCLLKLEELSLADLDAPQCETVLIAIKSLRNLKKIDLTSIKLVNEWALVEMLSYLLSLEELVLTDMSGTKMDNRNLFSAIKLLKRLRRLSLGGVELHDGVEALFNMLSSLPILEDVVFPKFDFMNYDFDRIPVGLNALESLGFLRSLNLCNNEIDEPNVEVLARVLTSLQLLEKVGLKFYHSCRDESVKEVFAAFGKLKYLKEVSVVTVSPDKIAINALAEVLPSLHLLTKLHLYFVPSDEHEKLLFCALGKLRYLKELSGNWYISNDTSEVFTHALSSLQLLEKLELQTSYKLSNNECVKQLYSAIGRLKYLRKLDLCLEDITNNEAEALAKVLPSLELLEELMLSWRWWDELGSEHEKQVFAAIGKLKYLKKLYLHWKAITDSGAEDLGKMLSSLRLLEELKLEGPDVVIGKSESESKELFIALGKLKYLKKLHLGWSIEITHTNVEALVRAFLSCGMLEKIKLDGISCLNESQCKQILITVCKLKYLKELYLRWEKITRTNVDTLVEALISMQMLEMLTLWVEFYCSHDCDDGCDDDCDKDWDDECDQGCDECRHDEHERRVNYVKKKVITVVKKLKCFKKFKLDTDVIYSRITDT